MRTRIAGMMVALGIVALAAPAGAAGTVTIGTSARSGDTLTVSGGSTYTAQPFLTLGTDGAADAPTGFQPTGGDLTAAAISGTMEDTLVFQFTVDQMPSLVSGNPGILFGWNFCVTGGDCYELDWTRVKVDPDTPSANAPPHWYVFRCGDADCTPAQQVRTADGQAQVFASDRVVRATVALTTIGASPGDVITAKAVDSSGPVFTALGGPNPSLMQRGSGDGILSIAGYRVPKREVSVAVAPAGLAPEAVGYTTTVAPSPAGAWSASVDVSGLSGSHAVYARACFGDGNCAYTSAPISL